MSTLTSSIVVELVGRLDVREGVLELALPRGVRAEGVAGRRRPGAVEPDQLGRDLADRLLRPPLGLRPVRAPEPVQRGGLAADVARDLVELVGGYVQPVARLATLRGGVLQDEVLPRRARDRALHHLDVAADAVLLVDHVVAGAQLQRVDDVPPLARQPPHVLGRRALPHQVGLGEHGEAELGMDEAVLERSRHHVDDVRVERRVQLRRQPRGDARLAQALVDALRRAVTLGHQHDAPARRPASRGCRRARGRCRRGKTPPRAPPRATTARTRTVPRRPCRRRCQPRPRPRRRGSRAGRPGARRRRRTV